MILNLDNLFSAYKSGLRKLINQQINDVSLFRNESSLDEYISKFEDFKSSLKNKEEIEIAKTVLEKQLNNADKTQQVFIQDEISQLNEKLDKLTSKSSPIVNNTVINVNISKISTQNNNVSIIQKTATIPTINFKNLVDNIKSVFKNIINKLNYHKPKENNVYNEDNISQEPKPSLKEAFQKQAEKENPIVKEQPTKKSVYTPVGQKITRPTFNEHKQENSVSKSIDKHKKTTKL